MENKEWFEFVGLMLGDGSMRYYPGQHRCKRGNSCFCVAVKDRDEIREKILIPLGVLCRGSKPQGNAVKFYVDADLTEKLGWSNGKTVPKLEFFTDDQLASVLRGCFESDGGVSVRKNGWKPHVRFYNSNYELVEFVCSGLERLGIKFSLRSNQRSGRKCEYAVYVRKRSGNLELFKDKIGFITDRKNEVICYGLE